MIRRLLESRWVLYLLLLLGLGLSLAPLGSASGGSRASHYFTETSQLVTGRFYTVWKGEFTFAESVMINGYPISDLHEEVSPGDGKVYQAQWFERARYEYHPENQPPNDVQLALLGVLAAKGRENEAPFQRVPEPPQPHPATDYWFQETGHTLNGAFRDFWGKYGRVGQFGFPISEPFQEGTDENGQPLTVQYFQRYRFEQHTGPDGQPTVVLTRLGAQMYKPELATPIATLTP